MRFISIGYVNTMKAQFFLMSAALLPSVYASPLPEKAELLASNTVVAQYLAMEERPCMGRTALCPDRCGHALRLARFLVLSNEQYEKSGQYGDDKAEPGNLLLLDAANEVPGQSELVLQRLAELKPGQVVRIVQRHYYAEYNGVHTPIRPVELIEVLKDGACEDLLPSPQDPANHDNEVMPLPL